MNTKEAIFLQTIEDNKAIIYKVALLYTSSVEDRKDLIQEIILQLWKSFEQFANRAAISTWLYRVAMNTAFHYIKYHERLQQRALAGELALLQQEVEGQKQEMLQEVLTAIQALNALDKGLVLLYLEEKSHQEIAHIMGISTSNVGTRLQRAKQKLKTIINTQP